VLLEKLDVLRAMLHGFDYSGFKTGGHKTLAGAANHVLGLVSETEGKGSKRDGKKRFADAALAMSKAFSLCCTLDEAKAVRDEVAFMQAVKVILTKRDISAQKKTDEQRDAAIRQIINQAVVSERWWTSSTPWAWKSPTSACWTTSSWRRCEPARAQPGGGTAGAPAGRRDQVRFATNVVQQKKFSRPAEPTSSPATRTAASRPRR
jgi:hypothetical protein